MNKFYVGQLVRCICGCEECGIKAGAYLKCAETDSIGMRVLSYFENQYSKPVRCCHNVGFAPASGPLPKEEKKHAKTA